MPLATSRSSTTARVGDDTLTGDVSPNAEPATTWATAPSTRTRGTCAAATCWNDGAESSSASGSAIQSCSPWRRCATSSRSFGVRSEWTMPLPADIQLTAPGSIRWTTEVESRCMIAPSNR